MRTMHMEQLGSDCVSQTLLIYQISPTNISILTLPTSSLSWLLLLRAKTWLQETRCPQRADIYRKSRARLFQKCCHVPTSSHSILMCTTTFLLFDDWQIYLDGFNACNKCLSVLHLTKRN